VSCQYGRAIAVEIYREVCQNEKVIVEKNKM